MSKFVKNSIYYSLIGFLPMALGVFTLPLWGRYISPSEMGDRSLISSFIDIISVVGSFQIFSSMSRLYFDMKSEEEVARFYSSLMNVLFIISIIIFLIIHIWHFQIIEALEFGIDYYPNFFYGVVSGVFALPVGLTNALIKVQEKAKPLMIISMSMIGLDVLTKVILVVYFGMGLEGYMLSTAFVAVMTFVLHFVLLIRYYKFWSFNVPQILHSFQFGIPLIPHALGGYLFMYSDKVVLARFIQEGIITKTLIAVYGIAEVFASMFKIVVNSYAKAITPPFMRLSKKGEHIGSRFTRMISREWFLILGIFFMLFTFSQDYMVLFFAWITNHEEYMLASQLMPFLLLSYLIRGFYILPINTFYFHKKTYLLPIVTLSSGVLNVVLNFLLIPIWGIHGSAIATAISFAVNGILVEYFTRFTFKLEYDKPQMFLMFGIVAFSFVIEYLCISIDLFWAAIIKFVIVVSILGPMFWFNFLGFKDATFKYVVLMKIKKKSKK